MIVGEEHLIINSYHPYAETLNKKLLVEVEECGWPLSYQTNVMGQMSSYRFTSDTTKIIKKWIISILLNEYSWLSKFGPLSIIDCWVAKYNVGDYTISHDHIPYPFSWVYFINCPKGSSPLVFTTSNKKIKAEDGKVIIFPGCLNHHVPKNKCDNRVVLAGNVVGGYGSFENE